MKPAFDVVYPSEFRSSVDDPMSLCILFVNTDVSPLSMATLQVRQLTDDHPTALVRIVTTPSPADIAPGFAGGRVITDAEPIYFDSGLVSEPRTDQNSNYAQIEFIDAPQGSYDITLDAVFGLDGIDVPLHITIHRDPGPTIYGNPEAAVRTQLFKQ